MGLTLEFLAGDARLLTAAAKEVDLDALYEPPACLQQADFSLHLIPHDLDLLSEALGQIRSTKPLPLRPFLNPVVDEADSGALEVARDWVDYVALCDMSMAKPASELWAAKMKAMHPDEEIEQTDEMTEAVESLLALCKRARTDNLDVIHVWFG